MSCCTFSYRISWWPYSYAAPGQIKLALEFSVRLIHKGRQECIARLTEHLKISKLYKKHDCLNSSITSSFSVKANQAQTTLL